MREATEKLKGLRVKREDLDEQIKNISSDSVAVVKTQAVTVARTMVSAIPCKEVSIKEGQDQNNIITVSFQFELEQVKKTGKQIDTLKALAELAAEVKTGRVFETDLKHVVYLPSLMPAPTKRSLQ